jgi:hypothetical protein
VTKVPALGPDAARLLTELGRLMSIAPELVASEVRPLVDSLQARERICDGCGTQYVQRQRHRRARNFHSTECRSHSRQCA